MKLLTLFLITSFECYHNISSIAKDKSTNVKFCVFHFYTADSQPHVNCRCSNDIVLAFCFFINFCWLLLGRPLLFLAAQLRYDFDTLATSSSESLPLDIGSHLILFLIAALLPFSPRFGLFSSASPRNDDRKMIERNHHKNPLMAMHHHAPLSTTYHLPPH